MEASARDRLLSILAPSARHMHAQIDTTLSRVQIEPPADEALTPEMYTSKLQLDRIIEALLPAAKRDKRP